MKIALILGFIVSSFAPLQLFAAPNVELLGAGATFPYPLYSKMFDVYYAKTGVKVNYQAIGSGGGIRQLLNKTVDFGATDAFMTDLELQDAPSEILHIPICLGAVVITYNLQGIDDLKLTGALLADIYLGKIKEWSDERIREINPGLDLPKEAIVVVHRSDGSGTTMIFTDYLSKASKEWEKKVGKGKAINWPIGLGAKGNPGVSGLVKQIKGSIGYVELAYVIQNKMAYASIKNSAGRFVKPTLLAISKSADIELPEDMRVSLTDTKSPQGYPISGFTWILVYKEQKYPSHNFKKAVELAKLLWWMIHGGQRYTNSLHYAPLTEGAVRRAERMIRSITHGGKRILKNDG